jgi:tRNA(Ile)-lysidine synthase
VALLCALHRLRKLAHAIDVEPAAPLRQSENALAEPVAHAIVPTGRLVVAHFNHALRAEADADEAFVRGLADRLGLACETARAEPASLDLREGLEAAAREARYRFLQTAAERLGARYVVTGHTADDSVETILHHILRGTGLAGLAGIPRTRLLGAAVTIIRPLLALWRKDVEEYLSQLVQPHCRDATNLSPQHTRNRIRHELLPLLTERFNPNVKDSLLRLGTLAGEAQEVLAGLAVELADRAATMRPGGEVEIDCRAMAGQPAYLVREMFCQIWRRQRWPLGDMTHRHWDELAEMAAAAAADALRRQVFPGEVTVSAAKRRLQIRRQLASAAIQRP